MSKNIIKIGREYKYITRNPVGKYLIERFFNKIEKIIKKIMFKDVIDVGCGDGFLLWRAKRLMARKKIYGIDLDPVQIGAAKKNIPSGRFIVGDIYKLPFGNKKFDLVICTEVLEHVEKPQAALKELSRITGRYCILSVPNEPIWRILNLLRGAYLKDWGNTEGHINHWTVSSFRKLVGDYFKIKEVTVSLPWTILLCVR